MHRPGRIPPLGVESFTPLSRAFEAAWYSPHYLLRSRTRATAQDILLRVEKKTFLGDIRIDIADIR
jgi:hypothetical protein